LVQRGVRVAEHVAVSAGEVRSAELTVTGVDELGGAWQDADATVHLRWDEQFGWTWQASYPGEPGPRSAIHFGFTAVPGPAQVANWMLVCLVHPETIASREDGPLTTPGLDAVLRGYAGS
jgi:hypothetical protein